MATTASDQVRALLEAFSADDLERMRDRLDPALVAWVTNSDGGQDRVEGRDAYLGRIEAMDLASTSFSVELTQEPVLVEENLVLAMVEVRAHRDGHQLHNFAAHLFRFGERGVTEWWMADAKPAESDEFWS